MKKIDRRKFIKYLSLGGALSPVIGGPVIAMIDSIIRLHFNQAQANSSGRFLKNYFFLYQRGGMSFNYFTSPPCFYKNDLYMDAPNLRNVFFPDGSGAIPIINSPRSSLFDSQLVGLPGYVSYSRNGIQIPHLWKSKIPTWSGSGLGSWVNMDSMIDNILTIRGKRNPADGHRNNANWLQQNAVGKTSILGGIADQSNAIFAAVYGGGDSVPMYYSKKSSPLSHFLHYRNVKEFLDPFIKNMSNLNDKFYMLSTSEIENAVESALDRMSDFHKEQGYDVSSLKIDRKKVITQIKTGLDNIETDFNQKKEKYVELIYAMLNSTHHGQTLTGYDDRIIKTMPSSSANNINLYLPAGFNDANSYNATDLSQDVLTDSYIHAQKMRDWRVNPSSTTGLTHARTNFDTRIYYQTGGAAGNDSSIGEASNDTFDLRDSFRDDSLASTYTDKLNFVKKVGFETMSNVFAHAEFLFERGLTNSLNGSIGGSFKLRSNSADTSFNGRYNIDSHGTGFATEAYISQKIMQVYSTVLREFQNNLSQKDSTLRNDGASIADDMMVHVASEFSRSAKRLGDGSDHAWDGSSEFLFSKMITKFQVIGNIQYQGPGHDRSWNNWEGSYGYAAYSIKNSASSLPDRYITPANVIKSIVTSLGGDDPLPNDTALFYIDTSTTHHKIVVDSSKVDVDSNGFGKNKLNES